MPLLSCFKKMSFSKEVKQMNERQPTRDGTCPAKITETIKSLFNDYSDLKVEEVSFEDKSLPYKIIEKENKERKGNFLIKVFNHLYPQTYDMTHQFFKIIVDNIACSHAAILDIVGWNLYSIVENKLRPQYFFVYPKLKTLEDLMKDPNIKLDDNQKSIIAYGVAVAMDFVHQKGLSHQCLNEKSIYLDNKYHPHIGDIGLKSFIDLFENNEKINRNVQEQQQEDIRSYGLLLYHLLKNDINDNNVYTYLNSETEEKEAKLKEMLKNTCIQHDNGIQTKFSALIEDFNAVVFPGTKFDEFKEYVNYLALLGNKLDTYEDRTVTVPKIHALLTSNRHEQWEIIRSLMNPNNSPEARAFLGVLYQNGIGILKDGGRAYYWFSIAKEQNYQGADNLLENLVRFSMNNKLDSPDPFVCAQALEERGNEDDKSAALSIYIELAKLGNHDAIARLGAIYCQQRDKKVQEKGKVYLERMCKYNNCRAYFALGDYLYNQYLRIQLDSNNEEEKKKLLEMSYQNYCSSGKFGHSEGYYKAGLVCHKSLKDFNRNESKEFFQRLVKFAIDAYEKSASEYLDPYVDDSINNLKKLIE